MGINELLDAEKGIVVLAANSGMTQYQKEIISISF